MRTLWDYWHAIVVSPFGFLAGSALLGLLYGAAYLWSRRTRRAAPRREAAPGVGPVMPQFTPEETELLRHAGEEYARACKELRRRLASEGVPTAFILGVPGGQLEDNETGINRVEEDEPRLLFGAPDTATPLDDFDDWAGEAALCSGAVTATRFRVVGCDTYGMVFVLVWFVDSPTAASPLIEFGDNWKTPVPVYYESDLEKGVVRPCGDLRAQYAYGWPDKLHDGKQS